jgi:hypothetical protein
VSPSHTPSGDRVVEPEDVVAPAMAKTFSEVNAERNRC